MPPAERVAAFDNDGTLWCEQPVYTQVVFAFDGVKAPAAKHSEWKGEQPFKAVLEGDRRVIAAAGEKGLVGIIAAIHAGMTLDGFNQSVLEQLVYLQANGFKTFIVSGGTADFMRPWAEKLYGVPPEQIVGTTSKTKYVVKDGKPAIVIEPHVDLIDDGPGKPVGIARLIGRLPVMAFGNPDGDFSSGMRTGSGSPRPGDSWRTRAGGPV